MSNRFAVAHALNRMVGGGPGPFWGCPPARVTSALTGAMKDLFSFPYPCRGGTLPRLRLTEAGMGVQETWKLYGAGSVGSQALTGIPRVRALRDDPDLRAVSQVWPFETGFTAAAVSGGPCVLHAEIWPGIVPGPDLDAEVASTGAIRDQAQVRLMCRWAAALDARGELGALLDPPPGLGEEDERAVVGEEGWIL
ncbi:MAG: cobalamin biosynthesis protein CbiG, partial [Actinomycetota bacterium]